MSPAIAPGSRPLPDEVGCDWGSLLLGVSVEADLCWHVAASAVLVGAGDFFAVHLHARENPYKAPKSLHETVDVI